MRAIVGNDPKVSFKTPPIHRFSMAYRNYVAPLSLVQSGKSLFLRRILFFALVLTSTWLAGRWMGTIVSPEGVITLKWMIVAIFSVLFGWISMTFWTAVMGFFLLLQEKDSFKKPQAQGFMEKEISSQTQIAIVVPVYNEEVRKVFSRLQVMYKSLEATGQLERFSFFVLSDSNQPHFYEQEEQAWGNLCAQVGGFGRIYYRRRTIRIHKKSGNISDFCRRWGLLYKYMIPLDADSLMSGEVMVHLVRTMEARGDIGILQTAPRGINQQSLISRINQFASFVYGPLLLAGSHFWQQEDGGFWGHNAIVRLEPFMKFCALPSLSGAPPFGGEVLSHDFIEAALMRRAGWGIWLAHDMQQSYEELPPNLLEELERDYRWCRGNIQHLRLMFMRGISFGHRFLFFNGNMFYFSAFLWLVLLLLMTAYAIIDFFHRPQYFPNARELFPAWPVHYHYLSRELLGVTMIFLFVPKILSVIWVLLSGKGYLFGGTGKLVASMVLETFFSILLAPIRMLFHSWFLVKSLLGGKIEWKKQVRNLKKTSLLEALGAHGAGSVLALIWGVLAFEVNQDLFWWLSIIVVPLLFAIPLSTLMSYPAIGSFFRKKGLFLTPVEIQPPNEIIRLNTLSP